MREGVHLELPQPPSVNDYWTIARHTHRMTPSATGRAYKEAVWMLTGRFRSNAPDAFLQPLYASGDIRVSIEWHRRLGRNGQRQGDLDNHLKVLLDAMQGSLYTNDKQIVDLRIYRPIVEEGAGGKVYVDVSLAGP